MPQSGFEEGFTVATSGSLDEWVKEVHAKVPGAIEEYIYDQLKLVIKDYFQRTKAWRAYCGPYTIPANDGELCVNPIDAYSNAIMIMCVYNSGFALTQIPIKSVPAQFRTETNQRNPSRYYLSPYDTIKLSPTNTEDLEDVYVSAALTPRLRADNRIPQWILDQHYEAIKAGLLQRLYEEPGKIYTNTVSADFWGKKYRAESTRARAAAIQNYGEMPNPWSYNKWNM